MSRYDELLALINTCGVAPQLGDIGQGFLIEQNPVELAQFLVACEERGVKSMLEIGTGEGGGFALLCYKYLGWSVTSIDHRAPLHESGHFILGETNDDAVYAQVKDQRFDLVLIDADHHYESVVHDYDWYAPLATKMVAVHDVAPGREGTQGPAQFWRQICETTGAGGIGTIIDPAHPIGIGWYGIVQMERT